MKKPIPGFEDYLVDEDGKIYSPRYGYAVRPNRNKATGRMVFRPYKNGKRHAMQIHRAVALAFLPNPESKPQVNHINGDFTDNRLCNLEWVTPSENMFHDYCVLGRIAGNSKIKPHQAECIRALVAAGARQPNVGALFGITGSAVSRISSRDTWGAL